MNAPLSIQSSPSIAELSKALISFHRRVPKIPKSCRNPFLKSRYADLSTILDIVQPVLNDCELVIQQHPTSDFGLTTILSHSSGEWMSSEYRMMPSESVIEKAKDGAPAVKGITPQSIGSVITYQRRYAIGAILSLNIDDDTDGHQPGDVDGVASGNIKPAVPQKSVAELMAEAAAKVDVAEPSTPPTVLAAEPSPSLAPTLVESTTSQDGDSTSEQRARIEQLYQLLNVSPEQQIAILAKRGLSVLRSLTSEQAAAIIAGLEKKLPTLDDQGTGKSLSGVHEHRTDGPCSDDQVTAIKKALVEWEQSQEGVTAAFIQAMNSAGFAKMKDMSFGQARSELANIEVKNIANFFSAVVAQGARETRAAG
jgi:hypothetical protein